MNKTAIKNFAIWARNKLIADISYRAGLMGITADGIHAALPQSTGQTEFYDIGTAEPYAITGEAILQRRHLVELIQRKETDTDYKTAYKYIIEEVAYTWFNRLIAVRFMEVNDYLPSHIRVLSSDTGKLEPDLVTTPFDAELELTRDERQTVLDLKNANKLDEVFRMLFIKQCNALNEILPALFEKTNDYTELLLNLSVIDQDGVVYHLVHDIPEEDFNVERGGQVEIIGWLYQYYNTELNEQVYDGSLSREKISKELLPAATTIYTPDWAIRYMVDNSLGKIWIDKNPSSNLWKELKYFIPKNENDFDRISHINTNIEEIKLLDPCMGSGHILVYAFDVFMKIYEENGYSQRDAAKKIVENNIYGLDIDDRAFQLSYFALMMKARYYSRRIFEQKPHCNIFSIKESNFFSREALKYFGNTLPHEKRSKAISAIGKILDTLKDAKEYGSILFMEKQDWRSIKEFVALFDYEGQLSIFSGDVSESQELLKTLIDTAEVLAGEYDVVITNPPYLGSKRFNQKLDEYTKKYFADERTDLSMVMYKQAISKLSKPNGLVAFITTSSWMTNTTFAKLRDYIQHNVRIISLVDFGTELFEGKVGHNPVVAWVSCNQKKENGSITAIRLVDYCYSRRDEKEEQFFNPENRFSATQDYFSKIDGQPIAYWISDKYFNAFNAPTLSNFLQPKQGTSTGDNNRFLRLWYEVKYDSIELHQHVNESTTKKWFPATKGGDYRKWYGNNEYIVDWENNGARIKNCKSSAVRNAAENFKEGLTWTGISSKALGIRYCPPGFVYLISGKGIVGDRNLLKYVLAFCCSNVADSILRITSPSLSFEVGYIAGLPLILDKDKKEYIDYLANENIMIEKDDWDSFENSWDFQKHPLTYRDSEFVGERFTIKAAYEKWVRLTNQRFEKVKKNEEELNQIFINIYNLKEELSPSVDEGDVTIRKANIQRDIRSLLSYAIGCMFGRYSLKESGLVYAGGDWNNGKYDTFIPDVDNIIPITDEEYLEDDIVSRLCTWLKTVYGEQSLEENLDFIATVLGNKGESSRERIRNYFLNDFFKDHCQTYSVTGSGKRPIYWLFDSGKQNGFKALIYLHRYNADTIGNLRIDYLHRMQRVYESEISRMQDMIDHSTNAREVGQATNRRDKLIKQLKECREYDEKLAHLALSRIELDLDDGVKVNYRKLQTANDGKFYEVLADSKNIMSKK